MSLLSCSKKDATPDPIPVEPLRPDTLTAGWSKQQLNSQNYFQNNFADIYFANNSLGYVAGSSGIYRSVDGGINWTILSETVTNLSNIAVTPDGKFYAVNNTDTVYSIENGSNTLVKRDINQPGFSSIFDIFFTNNNNGFVASSLLNITTDAGNSWQRISPLVGFPSPNTSNLFFLDGNTGWVANRENVVRTNGNIGNWAFCNVPAGTFNSNNPISVFAASPLVVFLGLGNGTILRSFDGGSNFTFAGSLPNANSFYVDMHFLNENLGYASSGRKIYKTVDGGLTWDVVVALGNQWLVEIHFTDANHGWACGSDGVVLRFNL